MASNNCRRLSRAEILFFCGDNNRGERVEGLAYSRQLDSLYDSFTRDGFECLHIAYANSNLIGTKAWGFPISFNRIFQVIEIFQSLCRFFSLISFNKVRCKDLKTILYERILSNSSVKYIFTVGVDSSLCKVCRRMGVPIIEVLHGYGYEDIPWGLDKKHVFELPTHVISFDEISTNTFNRLQDKDVRVIPLVDYWHKNLSRSNLSEDQIEFLAGLKSYNKTILVTLTWGYDGEKKALGRSNILKNGYIPKELINVIRNSEKLDIHWLIRIHPRQLRNMNRYPRLFKILEKLEQFNKKLDWKLSSEISLPYLLELTHGHITMISETSYEAATYGIKTLLLCPSLRKNRRFKTLISKEMAVLGDYKSYEEIYKWVIGIEKVDKYFIQGESCDIQELMEILDEKNFELFK